MSPPNTSASSPHPSSQRPDGRGMGGFDGIGGTIAARVMAAMNVDMERAALALLEPHDGERFLVVGFGPGLGLAALLDAVIPASLLGIDPSRTMVRAARRRLARHPRASLAQLLAVTAAGIPDRATFDAAIAVNNEQLWDPHLSSLGAIARALRPGGRLVTLTHQWAITKRATLAGWTAMIEADLAVSGLAPPTWTESRFRSGSALAYRTRKVAGMDAPTVSQAST
jgi:SAM-dependent methyltransferase